jgi:hypothetical protein
MQQNDRFFFEGFLLAIILTFLPFKAIAFTIPFIFFLLLLVRSKSGLLIKKFTFLVLISGAVLSGYFVIYLFEDHTFIVSNGILSFISYSSFLILFLIPKNIISEKYNYEFYVKVLLPFMLVEGLYGISQRTISFFKGINHGDLVEGTINPLSAFVGSTSGFGNQFFTINLIFLLIFCFPYVYKEKKGMFSYGTAFLAVILASVGHAFYSLILAVILVLVYYEGKSVLVRPKRLMIMVAIPALMVIAIATFDEKVYNDSARQANLFFSGDTPKSKAIEIVFQKVSKEYSFMHSIGLGPGQYSSRAGLIASGHYGPLSEFFLKLPFFNLGMTEAFRENVLHYWLDYQDNSGYGNSTMNRPFLSLLSLYSEFGAFTLTALMVLVAYYIHQSKKMYRKAKKMKEQTNMLLCYVFSTSLLFLIFIGLYENYYEAPQGVFIGTLLIFIVKKIIVERVKKTIMAPVPEASVRIENNKFFPQTN